VNKDVYINAVVQRMSSWVKSSLFMLLM